MSAIKSEPTSAIAPLHEEFIFVVCFTVAGVLLSMGAVTSGSLLRWIAAVGFLAGAAAHLATAVRRIAGH